MMSLIPLIDKIYILEGFEGKGGWTFARIPEIVPRKDVRFGWIRVRGTIDGYEIKNYRLQSMGNGILFLPIKSEIRCKIKKAKGDHVHIILYEDELPTEMPEEMELSLKDDPHVYEKFSLYPESRKKKLIEWVYSAKTDDIKVERMVKIINEILFKK